MDERSAAFLEVMAAIAIVGVVSFLVFLVSRQALRTSPGARPIYQPRWYELILAAVFVAAIAIIALLRLLPGSGEAWDEAGRATTFFVVMLIVGGGALIAFVLSLFWRLSHAQIPAVSAKSTQQETVAQPTLAQHRT
ncbi:MAG: hypothetical protein ACR2PF_03515, partial [Rhizobiaceae bacterium]